MHLPIEKRAFAFLTALLGASAVSYLTAQEAPRLDVEAPAEAVSGTVVESRVQVSVPEGKVLSWSFAFSSDGLTMIDASTAGTDFDRLVQGGYAESGVQPDGSAFYSVGVLSFTEALTLPGGRWELLRTRGLVTRKEPGDARLFPAPSLQVHGGRELRNEVFEADGANGKVVPLDARETSLAITGCAELALVPEGIFPGAFEVRRDSLITIRTVVRVASNRHLNPGGLTIGVAHDPAILRLESALLSEEMTALAGAGGEAEIEVAETGFAARVLAAPGDGATLGPGEHLAVTAAYSFQAGLPGGSRVFTRVGASREPLPGAPPLEIAFEPGAALPCDTPELLLELVVEPDRWIRGDTNSDGLVDISDPVAGLQHLFLGGGATCVRAMETNSDGLLDISDSIFILTHLFLGGDPPALPFPDCGTAEETLPCEVFTCPST